MVQMRMLAEDITALLRVWENDVGKILYHAVWSSTVLTWGNRLFNCYNLLSNIFLL